MNTNQFVEWLVEAMLGWSRWLADMLWGSINSGGQGGALSWFTNHWMMLVVFLIAVGIFVDWLIWMIRWRPYWLWFHKRQIVYAETPVRKRPRPIERDAYDDPFALSESADDYDDPFQSDDWQGGDQSGHDALYARPGVGTAYAEDDLWEGFEEEEMAPEAYVDEDEDDELPTWRDESGDEDDDQAPIWVVESDDTDYWSSSSADESHEDDSERYFGQAEEQSIDEAFGYDEDDQSFAYDEIYNEDDQPQAYIEDDELLEYEDQYEALPMETDEADDEWEDVEFSAGSVEYDDMQYDVEAAGEIWAEPEPVNAGRSRPAKKSLFGSRSPKPKKKRGDTQDGWFSE